MPYVIASPCIDVNDKACVEECPVEAISQDRRVSEEDEQFINDNRVFFTEPLPGRDEPLGAPGGASKVGDLETDTQLVLDW